MKRFLLFCGDTCYPGGGWEDFVGSFDTIDDARHSSDGDWPQIVDSQTGKVVCSRDYKGWVDH